MVGGDRNIWTMKIYLTLKGMASVTLFLHQFNMVDDTMKIYLFLTFCQGWQVFLVLLVTILLWPLKLSRGQLVM